MKKLLCVLLLLSTVPAVSIDRADKDEVVGNTKTYEHDIFLDVSLCDDDENEYPSEDVQLPESSPIKEWFVRMGCTIVAKFYATKQFLGEKYENTKNALINIKRYYLPINRAAKRN